MDEVGIGHTCHGPAQDPKLRGPQPAQNKEQGSAQPAEGMQKGPCLASSLGNASLPGREYSRLKEATVHGSLAYWPVGVTREPALGIHELCPL